MDRFFYNFINCTVKIRSRHFINIPVRSQKLVGHYGLWAYAEVDMLS